MSSHVGTQEDLEIKAVLGKINNTVHANEVTCLKFKEQFDQ